MIRSVLALADGGAKVESTLQTAIVAARRLDAYLDVLHVRPDPESVIQYGVDAAAGVAFINPLIEQTRRQLSERAARARAAYDKLAGVSGLRVAWREEEGAEAPTLAAAGRLAELVVIAQPGDGPDDVQPESVNAALFETGHPVLVAPAMPMPTIATRVAVAWNDSIQAVRAVSAALPFMVHAEDVAVLTAAHGKRATSADGLVAQLARHGVKARTDTFDPGSLSARARGRALLQHAGAMQADLLVMGAYGQGRVMQFLGLGGATAKVITANPMPLLMAH